MLHIDGDRTILSDKGGLIISGINACGAVFFKQRKSHRLKSRLIPIVNEMVNGNVVAHFSLENNIHHKSMSTIPTSIMNLSNNKVSAHTNAPVPEAIAGSHAISTRNDSVMLCSTRIAMPKKSQMITNLDCNGRVTSTTRNINGQPTLLISVYGVTSTCGSKPEKDYTNMTAAEISTEKQSRAQDRKDAMTAVNTMVRQRVTEAQAQGATVILFTDANSVDNASDRSSSRASTKILNGKDSLLTTIDDLKLLDVWKHVPTTKMQPGYTFTKRSRNTTSYHRIDRMYICPALVDKCGGFNNIRIAVAANDLALSTDHNLLLLRLPDSFNKPNMCFDYTLDNGLANRRFILTEDETTLWAKLVEKDHVLRTTVEEAKQASNIVGTDARIICTFPTAARAMNHLGITKAQAGFMKLSHIDTAFATRLKEPEWARVSIGDLITAKRQLIKIVHGHNDFWDVQTCRQRWLKHGGLVQTAIRERGRHWEQHVLEMRKPYSPPEQRQHAPTDAETMLLEILDAWNLVDHDSPDQSTITAATTTVSKHYNAIQFMCTLPANTTEAFKSFNWQRWHNTAGYNGLPVLAAILAGLESERDMNTKHDKQNRTCTAKVVGTVFAKDKGSTMSGLQIKNKTTGGSKWVSTEPELRTALESDIKHTSRLRTAGYSGQSIVVTTWMQVLVETTTMWNDTIIKELIQDKDVVGERWHQVKNNLESLQTSLHNYLTTNNVNPATTVDADTIEIHVPSQAERDHDRNKLIAACQEQGFVPQGAEQGDEWLQQNLTELKLTITFVDHHWAFLFDCMASKTTAPQKATDKWRTLDVGPTTIQDIERTARMMNRGKSHVGLSPEHVFNSATIQAALLFTSDYYFVGDLPHEMKTGVVTSLYKNCERFRPVTSLDVSFQLCECYHRDKEMELVVECGTDRQYGGVVGRSTSEPLLELEFLLEDALQNNKTLIAYYSDKTSAYDSVSPEMFPVVYSRWKCPKHISLRMSAVASGHRRLCKTGAGTDPINKAFPIESSCVKCYQIHLHVRCSYV